MNHLEVKNKFGHQKKISDTTEFKALTKKDAEIQLSQELEKLIITADTTEKEKYESDFAGFQKLFRLFLQGTGPGLQWEKIEPLPAEAVKNYDSLAEPPAAAIKDMINKLVVIKLNGGLGTSMGCTGPKSIIPVRNDLTFLDLTVQQIEHLNNTYDADVPLVLMNSFTTAEDTHKILRKYRGFRIKIYTFSQSKYPRIEKESLLPIVTNLEENDLEGWYPPGHGDFYESFFKSNLCEGFIAEGREYCFVSNVDNLGATVDISIFYCLNK